MIQNQLKLIPLSEIKVSRSTRQRSNLTPLSVYQLAISIAQNGLLQNIGIHHDSKEIIFGERRFTAINLLSKAFYSVPEDEPISTDLTAEQISTLRLAAASNKQYNDWTSIPCRLVKNADSLDSGALEFIENASREDLPWQDKASAAYKLHKEALSFCKTYNKAREEGEPLKHWTEQNSADLLGLSVSYFQTLIAPFRELESAGKKSTAQIKDAIEKSQSALAAKNAAKAIKERHSEPTAGRSKLQGKVLKPNKAAPESKPNPEPTPDPDSEFIPILNEDFHTWAPKYNGPLFNFLHCDFPYGINYHAGSNFNTGKANVQQGEYDDSPEVYWDLIDTLAKSRENLLAPQSHIMFWFSQNLYIETLERLMSRFPDAVLQKHLMIWVHPNQQTTPDPHRYGQRNYETALLITLGDRKIVKPKRLATIHNETHKIHRSQKPLPVLSHYFEMFVDSSTIMLDPTCGSATSLVAARQIGAQSVLGIEFDPDAHEQAVKNWKAA